MIQLVEFFFFCVNPICLGDSIGVPADSARKCICYFQIVNCFQKFDDLMVNVKSRHIDASAGAVGSYSTFYKHFKFLLCSF